MTKAESLLQVILEAAKNYTLLKISFGKKRNEQEPLRNIFVRPVSVRNTPMLSFVYRYPTNDITKNFDIEESAAILRNILENDFYNADVFTASQTCYYSFAAGNKEKLVTKPAANVTSTPTHDKEKKRIVNTNAPWLQLLGITGAHGIVKKDMQHKFRQINKYVEIIDGIISTRDKKDFQTVIDMGSGKGYLTFALYDHLQQINNDVHITGVELRAELVKKCNEAANACGFSGLHFREGSIGDYPLKETSMLIALHACDTATDDAIAKAVKAGAELIVCSPCCHKQIRKEMIPQNALKEITRHGILLERQAEMVTDTIRALMLEAYGYKTRVFDFIEIEDTAKNLLITAEKRKVAGEYRDENLKKIAALKTMFGIREHYLETLL